MTEIPKKITRTEFLQVRIRTENMKWIESEMKKKGYDPKRGKAEFVDVMLTSLREKK